MAVYRFPLSSGGSVSGPASPSLPRHVSVMHAGERICEARLEENAYVCDLPDEYAAKLIAGKLDQVFVFEPPIVNGEVGKEVERELVSILLVAARRGPGIDV
jgi:hypothetical protein